ncbi:nicotinate-nicotinamide nucleotide adenylyltransferase [Buchnera aphidicola]|uniref:nicotinate-nicotinamide nucleotide adenylyltransferase n=1 Tax=Buchnera aphidicola TaxID=9 RepID=UPI003464CC3B
MGEDNLINIQTWKEWNKLLNFCHLIICPRKNNNLKLNQILKKWIQKNKITNINLLKKSASGYIFFSKINCINISSTVIRNMYYQNQNEKNLVPQKVLNYIKKHNLYQDPS